MSDARPFPPFTPVVDALPASVPFVGPETLERQRGAPFAARIGANESGFGPSPMARAAIEAAAAEAWKYGDPECFDLKQALSARLGVAPEKLVVGEGIDGLLGYAVRLFATANDKIVTSRGAYPTFNYHVAGAGAELVLEDYVEDREHLPALIERARRERARMVYFANPDNPMGSWWRADEIVVAAGQLPESCILCLDEAYIEMAPADAAPAFDMLAPNVLRFRTFSKLHGLAGLRVGYAIGAPELVSGLHKIRNHFGVGRVAQAGALAALADAEWTARMLGSFSESRARLAAIAESNGLTPLPSATNFVAMDCGGDGALSRRVVEALGAAGVFVRMPGVPPLDRCIRVSCGPESDMAAFAAALPAALAAARGA